MEIPRFDKKNVNPRLATSDIGDAFQAFIHELLLPDHPNLHRFPSAGKDGGIDLIETSETCFVVECKVVGVDEYVEIERRWKKVRNHLDEHLRDPNGPTSGQSQYSPWYSTSRPIAEYVFCVSASFANEQQLRVLQKVIVDFFHELADSRSHLSHLKSLQVSIVDWNDLATRLRQHPHLTFRWFPSFRPNGLVPIDEALDVGTFRAYLTNAKLPYYSLSEHLKVAPAPGNIGILDEENLLAHFENPEITGLVISGKGGIGKTRLTLELGWLALRKGWSVLRVQGRLRDDALEVLAERLTSSAPALLLVDYIETLSDFGELVESMNLLDDSGIARLRYVASCRTGYYHKAIVASSRHLPIDLTPPPGDVSLNWYSDYRRKTVEQILTKAGLLLSPQHVAVCHDLPILAVFLAYLHTAGRDEDLAELIAEIEFGQWVAKRVQLSFHSKDVSRDLALLLPMFPMTYPAAERLDHDLRPVFDRLATDGWVERVASNTHYSFDAWMTAHDVLADQILLSYLRSIPNTTDVFLGELFSLATETSSLASTIVSLQRIADTSPLNSIQWPTVITNAIADNESHWKLVRNLLLTTSLLTVPEKVALLHDHDGLWSNAEQDISFQNSVGWFARWAATGQEGGLSHDLRDVLIAWISKSIPFTGSKNFVITWGLRLAPEIVREAALRWITTRPLLIQTQYLMSTWLEAGLSTEPITGFVQRWCQKFSQSFQLSFLAVRWLYAKGEKELIQDSIKEWLVSHKTDAEASHVYNAWLHAGGDQALVQDSIKEWLDRHETDAEARFVYKAWLDAGGDRALVQDSIKEWLDSHKTDAEARFVYTAWLNAGGEKALYQDSIKEWLDSHKTDAEADFVYNAWLDTGGDQAVVRDSINEWLNSHKTDAEAQFLYKAWLDAGGDQAVVQDSISEWLDSHNTDAEASHVFKAWLHAGGDQDVVQDSIKEWLVSHKTDADAQFVYQAWLDAGGDKALVHASIKEWLVSHKTDADAQFVYQAWLDAGGELAVVQDSIKEWLVSHKTDPDAQFVYQAWLDAGGELAVVQDSIKEWLVSHKSDAEASYVFKPWLDAGGEKTLVKDALEAWLLAHREDSDADHVFRSWLEAGGDRDLVWDAAIAWLAKHRHEESAVYVTKIIAKQRDLPVNTVKDVLAWCRAFSTNEDALWRLTQLGRNLFVAGCEYDVVTTAETVLADLLQQTNRSAGARREQVTRLFSFLIDSPQLQWGQLRERVDSLFVRWLRHPLSFGRIPKAHPKSQRIYYIDRIATIIASGILDTDNDCEPIKRFMRWVDTWDDTNLKRASAILNELKQRYPSPELWDIVRSVE